MTTVRDPSDLVARLRTEIAETKEPFLPSVVTLARKYRVRLASLVRAMEKLRDEGVVEYRKGQRVRIAGRVAPSGPCHRKSREPAADRFADVLRKQITDGTLKVGDPLPKVAYLATRERVSAHTVQRAYAALSRDSLASKVGRQWVVGPSPSVPGEANVFDPGFILLVQPTPRRWASLYQPRTMGFSVSFMSEIERTGTALIHLTIPAPDKTGDARAECRQAIHERIRGTAGHYRGALVIGRRSELPSLALWLDELAAIGNPVVWFDSVDEGLSERNPSRLVTRCHFAEHAGIETAAGLLADMGHRVVGYPAIRWLAEVEPWVRERGGMLESALREVAPQAKVVVPEEVVYRSKSDTNEGLAARLRHLLDSGEPFASACVSRMLTEVKRSIPQAGKAADPLLLLAETLRSDTRPAVLAGLFQSLHRAGPLALCIQQGATVLVAANDAMAVEVHGSLNAMDLRVPHDVSLISFDNYPATQTYPISTVDFGMGGLGYAAFHAIAGDVPLRRDRTGAIAARPRVVRKGSVGPPRSQARLAKVEGEVW